VYVTIWDVDEKNLQENPQFIPFDEVDEFSFNFFEPMGANPKEYTELGLRPKSKTR